MKLKLIVRPGMTKYVIEHLTDSTDLYKSVELDLDYEQSLTLEELLIHIGIPLDDCGLVIYNEQRLSQEDTITNDGTIKIYPPIIGG